MIKAENISKCYRIGVRDALHDSIGSALLSFINSPLKNYRKYRSLYKFDDINSNKMNDSNTKSSDIIWALKDVCFEIKAGEVVGIIGRNGAGKSTLLKILSKITDPTSGRAEIRGRVASLLEVGTGFHPELTGRENVFLNGAVLGMDKKEIESKFDEIVEFSGVEKFIDTPVKRYSSGMKVRLAFSVAAHLEPELLLVDEVLAVGDAEFQQKCLGKMGRVSREGRTVLFVSHNMGAIAQLCPRSIWLEEGKVKLDGSSSEVIGAYLSSGILSSSSWTNSSTWPEGSQAQIKSARLLSPDNQKIAIVNFDSQFRVEITYEIVEPMRNLSLLTRLTNSQGNVVWTSWDTDTTNWDGRVRGSGRYISVCKAPGGLLKPGHYQLSVGLVLDRRTLADYHEHVLRFEVSQIGYLLNLNRLGIITPLLEWDVQRIDETCRTTQTPPGCKSSRV